MGGGPGYFYIIKQSVTGVNRHLLERVRPVTASTGRNIEGNVLLKGNRHQIFILPCDDCSFGMNDFPDPPDCTSVTTTKTAAGLVRRRTQSVIT